MTNFNYPSLRFASWWWCQKVKTFRIFYACTNTSVRIAMDVNNQGRERMENSCGLAVLIKGKGQHWNTDWKMVAMMMKFFWEIICSQYFCQTEMKTDASKGNDMFRTAEILILAVFWNSLYCNFIVRHCVLCAPRRLLYIVLCTVENPAFRVV